MPPTEIPDSVPPLLSWSDASKECSWASMTLLYAWNAAAGLSEPESTAARMLPIRPRSLKKAFSCACGPAESRPFSVCSAASAGGIALVDELPRGQQGRLR